MLELIEKPAPVNILEHAKTSNIVRWLNQGFWAVADQGLFAISNFVLNILLARWLAPEQYGAFATAFAVFLLLGTYHSAILTEPMLVFGAGKHETQFRSYLGILLTGHAGLALAVSVIIAIIAMIFWTFGPPMLAQALGGLALASPFILLLWLLRRAFYVVSMPQYSAAGGALYLALMLAGVYGLFRMNSISSTWALTIMGIASLVVSLWFLTLLRPGFYSRANPINPRLALIDHWNYGKWSIATAALIWVPGNIFYVLLPLWAGLEGSAALRAIMNLIMPMLQAHAALSVLLVPVFVRALRKGNSSQLKRKIHFLLALFIASSALYWILLVLFRHNIFIWLYGGRYEQYAGLLFYMGLIPLSSGIIAVLGSILRALQMPDKIFWCYVASSVSAVTLGVLLTLAMSVKGAAVALLISSYTTAFLMMWFYLKSSKRLNNGWRELSNL